MFKKIILIQVILSFLLFLTAAAGQAQMRTLTVSVYGLQCPFCAYGLEKSLKKIEAVKTIKINLEKGLVTLSIKKGRSINISRVRTAIKNSGFTPKKIKITAAGIIKINGQHRFLLQLSKPDQELLIINLKKTGTERLLSLAKSGATVEINGIIRKKSDGTWTLSPESVKKISE